MRNKLEHPEETCEECGRPNVTWFAPSPIWNAAVRKPEGRDLMLCPVCFIKRAVKAGYNRDAWIIQPEFYKAADVNRGWWGLLDKWSNLGTLGVSKSTLRYRG